MLFDTIGRRMLALGCSIAWLAATPAFGQLTVTGFTNYSYHGFNVLVNDQALADHQATVEEALAFLETKLGEIVQLDLAPDIIADFQQVPIFMEWYLREGAAWYHPSAAWLAQNGYPTEKAKAVEVSNIRNFVAWSKQNQPMMVLHELVHAYHDQVLGYGHEGIVQRFNAAVQSGSYESVPYNPGFGAPFNQRAYALNNEIEYFAEITEAFFGENDYYPFIQSDLATHDPEAYALLQEIWRPAQLVATERAEDRVMTSAVYPNPSAGRVTVKVGPENETLQVFDLLGREVYRASIRQGTHEVDLGDQPVGLYLVRVSSRSAVNLHTLTVVR